MSTLHKLNLGQGFRLAHSRFRHEMFQMRFENEEQLRDARSMLGSTFAFGNNNRKPRIGKILLPHADSKISIVSGNSSEENPFRKSTSIGGIDCLYSIHNHRFSAKIRLKQLIMSQRRISRRMTCYEPLKSTLMLEK